MFLFDHRPTTFFSSSIWRSAQTIKPVPTISCCGAKFVYAGKKKLVTKNDAIYYRHSVYKSILLQITFVYDEGKELRCVEKFFYKKKKIHRNLIKAIPPMLPDHDEDSDISTVVKKNISEDFFKTIIHIMRTWPELPKLETKLSKDSSGLLCAEIFWLLRKQTLSYRQYKSVVEVVEPANLHRAIARTANKFKPLKKKILEYLDYRPPTMSEDIFFKELKSAVFGASVVYGGVRIYITRQYTVKFGKKQYRVDFLLRASLNGANCRRALVIEHDGKDHQSKTRMKTDAERDKHVVASLQYTGFLDGVKVVRLPHGTEGGFLYADDFDDKLRWLYDEHAQFPQ